MRKPTPWHQTTWFGFTLAFACLAYWALLTSGIVSYSAFGWDEADRRIFGTLAVVGIVVTFVDYIVKRANALEQEVHDLRAATRELERRVAEIEPPKQ